MKKIKVLLIGLLVSFCTMSFGQEKVDTASVVRIVDELADKTFLTTTQRVVIRNNERTKGFNLDVFFSTGGRIYLTSQMFGIGSCNEKDQLIILLEDGEKINLTSFNKFNCEGEGMFLLSSSEVRKLRSSPLSKIRITNGRTYDSYTGDVPENSTKYFIQVFNSYYSENYKTIKN